MPANYRAEHVGSLLRPPELLEARSAHQQGRITPEQLRELEDQAALEAIELQRQAGMQVFTDGEVRRENWLASVMESVGGLVRLERSQALQTQWTEHGARWTRDGEEPPRAETDLPPIAAGERLYFREPLSRTEAAFMAGHAPGQFKITMSSATNGVLLWTPGVTDRVYATPDELLQDLVDLQIREIETLLDLGVTWLQFDSLTTYMQLVDPAFAKAVAPPDVDPDAQLDHAITVDNTLVRAARARNPQVTVGLHFCRGNNRSAWGASGGYEPVAERLFGEVEVDRLLLEYDTERAGGFEPLRFVPPGKTVVLGLVSSKTPKLESQDALRRRIDEAARYVPLEQLALSPQCGFASTSKGNLLTVDDQRRKLALVVDTAQKVWG